MSSGKQNQTEHLFQIVSDRRHPVPSYTEAPGGRQLRYLVIAGIPLPSLGEALGFKCMVIAGIPYQAMRRPQAAEHLHI